MLSSALGPVYSPMLIIQFIFTSDIRYGRALQDARIYICVSNCGPRRVADLTRGIVDTTAYRTSYLESLELASQRCHGSVMACRSTEHCERWSSTRWVPITVCVKATQFLVFSLDSCCKEGFQRKRVARWQKNGKIYLCTRVR